MRDHHQEVQIMKPHKQDPINCFIKPEHMDITVCATRDNKPLIDSTINCYNDYGELIASLITDALGEAKFSLMTDCLYHFEVNDT